MEDFKTRALAVIECAFGGAHHVRNLKWELLGTDFEHCEFLLLGELSTWDSDRLTALVVACHDQCIRAEVSSAMRYLRVMLHPRVRYNEAHPIMLAHPTLEDHAALLRHQIDGRELFRRMRGAV